MRPRDGVAGGWHRQGGMIRVAVGVEGAAAAGAHRYGESARRLPVASSSSSSSSVGSRIPTRGGVNRRFQLKSQTL